MWRFNSNLKCDRKSSQSYNSYFLFFWTVFPCNIMKLLCNRSYCSHSDILSKKLSFFQTGDWRVLADDNRISCFCCWWWASESASKSYGARKTGGIFRTLVSIWRKLVPFRPRRVTRLPELAWASQLFPHFLAKLGEETKRWLVTLLVSATSRHGNTLTRSTGSIRSRRDNQSLRERFWKL